MTKPVFEKTKNQENMGNKKNLNFREKEGEQ